MVACASGPRHEDPTRELSASSFTAMEDANYRVGFELSELVPDRVEGFNRGSPIGIVAFVFVAVRLGVAQLPAEVGWGAMLGGGMLAGIGFTMALFISAPALEGDALAAAKVDALAASAVAALVGCGLLMVTLRPPGGGAGDAS